MEVIDMIEVPEIYESCLVNAVNEYWVGLLLDLFCPMGIVRGGIDTWDVRILS